MTNLLEALNVSKTFGSFEALKAQDFTMKAGEVRALVGSNGAGKTTMIKVLTGAHAPTTGSISVDGAMLPGGDPAAHIAGGIACIYQHSSLAPNLTVAENLFLGQHPKTKLGLLDLKEMNRRAAELIEENETDLKPGDLVADLPTVKQKEVEILKALALKSKIILMDEPTAWLSFPEVERLHGTIRRLKAQGVAVIYISHMMDEIFQICDSASILRDGALVWEGQVAETDRAAMVQHMLGVGRQDTMAKEKTDSSNAAELLHVDQLSRKGYFDDISFALRQGEILCITGLIGSKRTELVRCLFGADQPDTGSITVDGKTVSIPSPRHAIGLGIGFVPEDRRHQGLCMTHTTRENVIMAALPKFVKSLLLQKNQVADAATKAVETLNIQPPDPDKIVGTMSGGNQQKVLLGKWLETSPRIIILDEPTVGVDVGAKNDIYQVLDRLKAEGVGVLVVSSDVEEVQNIADRVLVMANGRLTESIAARDISHERLVESISGGHAA